MKGQHHFSAVQPGWSADCESPGRGDIGLSQNYFPRPDPAFVNAWQNRAGAVVVVVAYWLGEVPYTTSIQPSSSPQKPLLPISLAHQEGQRVTKEYRAHHFPYEGK